MAKSVYQISWFTEDGKRLGLWRSTNKPNYDSSYKDWCEFTRMDTQQLVTLNHGLVSVEEVEATSSLPVEKPGIQVSSG